ncbi:hypothetical protein NDU88_002825 [Pleurodeles waltl]|uniref:Uncharacterized protein n=1 Tax=Pleurodeles waltl TaxID=8319 RepID=A0AAV7RBE6_PLEWA|nr:hypothetical protein NDU88_002825 [Pleurodeles waltl]
MPGVHSSTQIDKQLKPLEPVERVILVKNDCRAEEHARVQPLVPAARPQTEVSAVLTVSVSIACIRLLMHALSWGSYVVSDLPVLRALHFDSKRDVALPTAVVKAAVGSIIAHALWCLSGVSGED